MTDNLQELVRAELQRRKGAWPQLARDIPGVSYSFIQKLGNGSYRAAPTYRRLRALADYFQSNPLPTSQSSHHSSKAAAAPAIAGTTTA